MASRNRTVSAIAETWEKSSHNLVYVLDALDAFKKKLVKQIEVKGFEIKNLRRTDKYIYLAEIVIAPNKPPRARLEFEVQLAPLEQSNNAEFGTYCRRVEVNFRTYSMTSKRSTRLKTS
jgi:type III restriction enzyme